MNNDKLEALQELKDIQDELIDLENRASAIVTEHFKQEKSWCDAYQVFSFGDSGNPYDSTFRKLIDNIERQDDEGFYDEGQNGNDSPLGNW